MSAKHKGKPQLQKKPKPRPKKPKSRGRIKTFELRAAKAKKLLRGRDYGRFVKTGMMPMVAYGAELTDFRAKDLASFNKVMLEARRMDVPGVSKAWREVCLGAEDLPEITLRLAPIVAYCKEVWYRTDACKQPNIMPLTAVELGRIWHEVTERNKNQEANKEEDDDETADPIDLLRFSLKAFGAYLKTPTTLVCSKGVIGLDVCSPKKVRKILIDHVNECFDADLTEKLQDKFDWKPNERVDGKRIRAVLGKKPAGNKRILMRIMADAIMTRTAAERKGILQEAENTQCKACGTCEDTADHRLWICRCLPATTNKKKDLYYVDEVKREATALGAPNRPHRRCIPTAVPLPARERLNNDLSHIHI